MSRCDFSMSSLAPGREYREFRALLDATSWGNRERIYFREQEVPRLHTRVPIVGCQAAGGDFVVPDLVERTHLLLNGVTECANMKVCCSSCEQRRWARE